MTTPTTILGYNIVLTIADKTVVGTTSNTLDIKKKIKESITKDDKGNAQRVPVGEDVTISVDNLINVSGTVAEKLYRDDVIDLALADDLVAVSYSAVGGSTYTGSATVDGYSETSNAEGDATASLNLTISGKLAKTTGA